MDRKEHFEGGGKGGKRGPGAMRMRPAISKRDRFRRVI
jgi:hypothetical protein